MEDKIVSGGCSDCYKFANRYAYPLKIEESNFAIKQAQENYKKLIERDIAKLRKGKNRAEALTYFENAFIDQTKRIEELTAHKAKGGKIIGTFCLQIPEEIIYALGAIPIRLTAGFIDAVPLAEEIMPKNICHLAKASIGFPFLKINPFFEMSDVISIPTTCDTKKKMIDVLSNIKDVWPLELPNDRESLDAMARFQSQMDIFKQKAERLTGKKLEKKALKKSIELLYNRTKLVRRLMALRKNKKIVLSGRDFFIVIQTAFFDDIHRWMEKVEVLIKELEANIVAGKTVMPDDSPRVMLTGSPTVWPNFKIPNLIEEQGALIAIDDSCAGTQYFYNPPEVTDWSMKAMLAGISNKYLLPTVCPVFVHNDDRIDRMVKLVKEYNVGGVVYHVLRLCQVMDFDYDKANHVLRQNKIPVLKVETEYGEEDVGQLRTRVEAFVEMINSRRN